MNIDFAAILTYAVLLTGIVLLLDKIFWKKKRQQAKTEEPVLIEYCRSFFPMLLIIWSIRSFLIQPYRVPTGSLEPTIMPGDFIAVNQFAYGLRLPVLNWKMLALGTPKRGDIALFRWPVDPKIVFVKRVVGVPGDHIQYKDKTLYINGQKAEHQFIKNDFDVDPISGISMPVEVHREDMSGIEHSIFLHSVGGETQDIDLVVPSGQYFMMGDNRDNSDDSRSWGFVPDRNLIGKAFVVWMSWDSVEHRVRWQRIGNGIH